MTDPIADMLTRIRNALAVKKQEVILPYSKIKFQLAKLLVEQGYLKEVVVKENHFKEIQIELKYDEKGGPAIRKLKRISKSGCRIYVRKENLPYILSGLGMAVISTSKGLMTNKEARKQGVGGEILCEIW